MNLNSHSNEIRDAAALLLAAASSLAARSSMRVTQRPAVKSGNNSTTTPLAAGATFTGIADPILGYQQVNLTLFAAPSTAKASLFFEFSPDGTNWDISVPILVRNGTRFIPYPLIAVGTHYRVRYLNDGGAAAIAALGLNETAGTPTLQTVFRLTSYLLPLATKEIARTLDQAITGSDPAALVRSINSGEQPDGDFINEKADGTTVQNTTSLAASGIFTSNWFDSDGWKSIELFIATDQISTVDGVEIQFTDDVDAATPVVRGSLKRSFTATDVTRGFLLIRAGTVLDGYRIKYTNGATPQGSFFIESALRTDNSELPQANYGADVTLTNLAVMTRGSIVAQNAIGTFGAVERGTSGGLDIGIVQHEVETPIKSLGSFKVTRVSVTTVAALVFTPDANCRSWTAKAIASAGRVIYVAESTVKATPSAGFPLQNAEWVGGDLSAGSVHASCDSGTQALAFIEVIV